MIWKLKTQTLTYSGKPLLMGIVNVTPDSFSDGGRFFDHSIAVDHALKLVEDGADILDIGGESTRPYSEPVLESEEIRRVVTVIEKVASQTEIPISIDTSKPAVAKAAVAAGAEIINDVTGLTDPGMVQIAAESGVGVCAMHMQGSPQTMQDNPTYSNVVEDLLVYLAERKSALLNSGIEASHICLDPGIGFGKTHEHNLDLIRSAERFLELECPILVGHSRKGFIGKLLGDKSLDRDTGTMAISLVLAQKGIHVIRVHEVRNTAQAIRVEFAIRNSDL